MEGRGWRHGPPWFLEAGVYLLLVFGAISPSLGSATHVVGDGVDLFGSLWFFWYIVDSIQTLHDPSWTDLFFFPYGKDVFGHTGNNFLDAVLAAPLQWFLGNPTYYKYWVAVVMLGNALSFRFLARRELESSWAVFVSTALYTVNPYIIFEITCGRPTQAFLWFLPLALWGVMRADRSVWVAVLGGFATAMVGYTYWFYGYFIAFAFVWLVGVGVVGRWRDPEGRPGLYLRNVGIAAAVTALLVAPWALAMLGSDMPVQAQSSGGLLGLPTSVDNGVSTNLHSYFLDEQRGARFLQHPAWALGALAWIALGRGRLKWLGVAVVGLLLATGPLYEWGDTQIRMWHYLVLHNGLPFFHRLWFPYRALVLVFLALSLGMGFAVQRILEGASSRWPARAWLLAPLLGSGLLAGTLAVEHQDYLYPFTVRDVAVPRVYDWMASQSRGAIIELPRGITHVSIVYQTHHRMPLFEGMGANVRFFWPAGVEQRLKTPWIKELVRAARHPDREVDTSVSGEAILRQGFSWVVLHRELLDSEQNRSAATLSRAKRDRLHAVVVSKLTQLLGDPVAVDGPTVVWALVEVQPPPVDLRPTAANLSERSWERPEPAPYEARLYELGRIQ